MAETLTSTLLQYEDLCRQVPRLVCLGLRQVLDVHIGQEDVGEIVQCAVGDVRLFVYVPVESDVPSF